MGSPGSVAGHVRARFLESFDRQSYLVLECLSCARGDASVLNVKKSCHTIDGHEDTRGCTRSLASNARVFGCGAVKCE